MANAVFVPPFIPRQYQLDTMIAAFQNGCRNFIDIEHRRAGKDYKWLQILVALSQIRVGTYLHSFPTMAQARRVVWTGTDDNGNRFIDLIPKQIIKKVNSQESLIEFKNGSIYRLAGADNFNAWMGTNAVGIVFSEFALQNPIAHQRFSPILRQNKGLRAYVSTPRGRNHMYHLYEAVKDNPDWFCQILTVTDTYKSPGVPVITMEDVEAERREGMTEGLIQQEYFCSFESVIDGSYFGDILNRAREDGRIYNFPIDTTLPVFTFWDIGQRDKTCIWFIQKHPRDDLFYLIGYFEDQMQPNTHYVNHIKMFQQQYGIVYNKHYLPHDSAKTESDNLKIIQKYRQLGLDCKIVPRVPHKVDAIETARNIIGKCIFHDKNCENGLYALMSYHAKRNDRLGVYGKPEHDWASDPADAFMQFAQTHGVMKTKNGRIIHNAVNTDFNF